jgi:hypothetical protein
MTIPRLSFVIHVWRRCEGFQKVRKYFDWPNNCSAGRRLTKFGQTFGSLWTEIRSGQVVTQLARIWDMSSSRFHQSTGYLRWHLVVLLSRCISCLRWITTASLHIICSSQYITTFPFPSQLLKRKIRIARWPPDAEILKFRFFWDIAPCSDVEVDRRFRGAYCLHRQGGGSSRCIPED